MIFNVAALSREFTQRVELYMLYVFNSVSEKNPNWIEDLKKNENLNRDNLTPEEIQEEVGKFLSNPDLVKFTADWEKVKELFVMDEEFLKQFIIEN